MDFNRGIDPKSGMDIGRGKYSKKEFEGYKFRASVEIGYNINGEFHYTLIDVYTDQKDRDKVEAEIRNRAKNHVISVTMKNWTSKLQDVLNAAFIDEVLKDL